MSHPTYTQAFDDVHAAEQERIAALRAVRGVGAQPLVGLALSGGGIRSAAYALGVLHAIAACGVFPMLDYLSTVSGGGYAGAALTWFLRDGRRTFPFGKTGPRSPLDRLRRQANYLSPTARLTLGALFAVVVQKAFLSLAVYGGLLVGLFVLLDVVDQAMRPLQALASLYAGPRTDRLVLGLNAPLLVGAACIAALLAQAVLRSVARAVDRWVRSGPDARERAYLRRRRAVKQAGRLLGMATTSVVVGTVPLAASALAAWSEGRWGRGDVVLVVIVVLGIVAVVRAKRTLTAPLVAFGMVYAFLLLTHGVAMEILFGSAPWMIWVAVGGALALGAITPLNAHGSGDVYRDRLAETFLPDLDATASVKGSPARQAASYPLVEACGPHTAGPYHLLNAALLTPASHATRRRQRGAEAFVLSPLYCGSEATGWRSTRSWMHGETTLAGAMATSGAAVDPYAAVAGTGATRGAVVSLVLSLLGLCLGHVATNPRLAPRTRRRWLPPNLLVPGIRLALFGEAQESGSWVTLADGGDFDALGIYELVRRRVEVIIAVDVTEDGARTFAALGNAVERVRVDFGVEITFDDLDAVPAHSAPRGHVVGRIRYPGRGDEPAFEGRCVYLKATMLAHAPADVVAHARQDPTFPHDSTFEQCFDECTFEAYRALGFVAASRMLDEPAVVLALAYPDRTTIDPGVRLGRY